MSSNKSSENFVAGSHVKARKQKRHSEAENLSTQLFMIWNKIKVFFKSHLRCDAIEINTVTWMWLLNLDEFPEMCFIFWFVTVHTFMNHLKKIKKKSCLKFWTRAAPTRI